MTLDSYFDMRTGRRPSRTVLPVVIVLTATALPVRAGMTVLVLSDLAQARLEAISFFAAGYLLLAWVVKGLWNVLAGAFSSLPRISYRASLSLMLVSGLLMYVVLTMISGARELMTPGAWEKQGIGYQLRNDPPGSPKGDRLLAMESLKTRLWTFAGGNQGKFPVSIFDPAFPRKNWMHPNGDAFYCYLPPSEVAGREILVYEPATAGPQRYVLLSDGAIEQWNERKLKDQLSR